MNRRKEAEQYIATQRSLHLYKDVADAFVDVLCVMPEDHFETVTKNLILSVLHEGAIAQVMHFEKISDQFKILQLTTPHDIPSEALRWVIAHEFGHVMQGRNWREEDGQDLELDANTWASKWGFVKTEAIEDYLKSHRQRLGVS